MASLIRQPAVRNTLSIATLASAALHVVLLGLAVLFSIPAASPGPERTARLAFFEPLARPKPASEPVAASDAPRQGGRARRVSVSRRTLPEPAAPASAPQPLSSNEGPSACGADCDRAGTEELDARAASSVGEGTSNPSRTATTGRPEAPIELPRGMSRPRLLQGEHPRYTEEARRARVEGEVVVRIEIRPDGAVRDVRVLRGLALLNDEVVRTVRRWRFSPPMHAGRPVAVYLVQPIDFSFED